MIAMSVRRSSRLVIVLALLGNGCTYSVLANVFTDTGHSATAEDFTDPNLRSVGRLYLPDESLTNCTATLVAPDIVVTAAHCVESDDGRPLGVHYLFITGGPTSSDGTRVWTVAGSEVAMTLHPDEKPELDVAFIRLEKRLDQKQYPAVTFDSIVSTRGIVETQGVRLTGFNQGIKLRERGTTEVCKAIAYYRGTREFTHDCSTTKGMSGSPLYLMREGKIVVVGLHNGAHASNNDLPTIFMPVWANRAAGGDVVAEGLKSYVNRSLIPK